MKIFVLGSTGMVGHVVSRRLKEQSLNVVDITRKDLDATWTLDQLAFAIKDWDIKANDFVINCVGIVPQRLNCYSSLFYKVNAQFPINLNRILHEKTKLIHISTNCVFSGSEIRGYNPHGYTEWDMPRPTDVYGKTKLEGEADYACMVIRTSVVGPQKTGHYSLYDWCLCKENITGYVDHYWNGVTSLQLADKIASVINLKRYYLGVHHLHSPNIVSKYELIRAIREINGFDGVVAPIFTGTNQWKTLASVGDFALSSKETPAIHDQLQELKAWY